MSMLILCTLAVIGFFFWAHQKSQSNKQIFFEKMRQLNRSHGTSFPENDGGMDFILSDGSSNGSLVFDPTTKKCCLAFGPKQSPEMLDFSYIRQWQLHWTEVTRNGNLTYQNVHFVFSTNDIKRPLIRIGVRNKNHGDNWNARLPILFG